MNQIAKTAGVHGRPKSLKRKVISVLLCVFILYAFVAFYVLESIQRPAFDRIERTQASDQITRVYRYIQSDRSAIDLMVQDWAQWDDTMEFVLGDNDGFLEDNLSEANLRELGMSFGAVIDINGSPVWGESYLGDESIEPLEFLFPQGIQAGHALLAPVEAHDIATGIIQTSQGLAIVSSAAIHWNDGVGAPGGHFILGKLLEADKLKDISNTLLTPIDILPVKQAAFPQVFHTALNQLTVENEPFSMVKDGGSVYALKLLHGITGEQLAILRVELDANISNLGSNAVRSTISMLVSAALLLLLVLWVVLNRLIILPIERLTAVFRGVGDSICLEESGQRLLSTVQHLSNARGVITRRNDEIGELVGAFEELTTSLSDSSASVWRAAHLDGLTGLANRRLFMERLILDVDHAIATSRQLAVLFIDLDDFKIINDRLGHKAGDQLLIDVAARLEYVVGGKARAVESQESGEHNLVARIGGDEFVVMLVQEESLARANELALSIVETIAAPFKIDNEVCHIGACVGVAVFPDDAEVVHEVLSAADAAMYEAKRAGKNSWRRYVPGLSRVQGQRRA